MISFVGKTVEAPVVIPGKRVRAIVVWKNNKFRVRVNKELYDLAGWDDLSGNKWIYALPTNTYYSAWRKKPYMPPKEPDKNVMEMTIRFWGKYFHSMTIYGKIVDNIFYQTKKGENESDLPEIIGE